MSTVLRAGTAVLLLAALTGCGATDGQAATSTSPAPGGATTAPASPSAPAHPEKLTQRQVKRVLLDDGDVPHRWSRDRELYAEIKASQSAEKGKTPTGCASYEAFRAKSYQLVIPYVAARAFTYEPDTEGGLSGVIRVTVSQFATEDEAKLHMDHVRAQAACPQFVANSSLGSRRLTPLKLAPVGHDAAGFTLHSDEPGYTAVELRVVRVGTVAVQMESAGGHPSVPTVAVQALEKQVAAVTEALTTSQPEGATATSTR